jgi:hypothetical protein
VVNNTDSYQFISDIHDRNTRQGDNLNLNRLIFTLQKRDVRYTAGLKRQESCRDSFMEPKILTIYSLHIQETILYAKQKGNFTVNEYILTQEIMIIIHIYII